MKRYRAIELAAVTAQLLGHRGNRVGLVGCAERPVGVIPPGRGRLHLDRVVGTLNRHPRSAARPTAMTDLTGALRLLERLARRPSLIVVVSDFLVPEGWASVLRRLAQRHEVVAARLTDPREVVLPDVGIVVLEDPETGDQLTVDTHDRRLRERFAAAAAEQTRRIDSTLIACGVDRFVLDTDRPFLPALAAFLEARKGRRAARGGVPAGAA
jgi:uncharacterized protein (DUF58 family)